MKTATCFLLSVIFCVQSFAQRGGEVVSVEDTIRTNYALVVGISSYTNIKPLVYADDDAIMFASYLIDEEICERKNVVKLIDSTATRSNFYKELAKFANKAQPNDRIFIYFAGHGDVETDIESGFLLCVNSESTNYPATDAIDIDMLEKYVNSFVNKKVKVVLITDACRSGNLSGGLTGARNTISAINTKFQNVIKMLSCQPNELSEEKFYPDGGHGVFTYHLINGLNGLADRNNDGYISLRELDIYLDEVTKETDQKQTPKIDGNPNARVVKYEESLKQVALAKVNNTSVASTDVKKHRGGEDSTWSENKYYIRFVQCIRKLKLTTEEDYSAYSIMQDAIKDKQPPALIEDMKLELSAVLEDELQKWINTFLRGEYDPHKNSCFTCVIKMQDYSHLLEELTPKNDFRFNEIRVKKIFFDIYHNWAYRIKEEYPSYIQQLEEADKLLPNQAWIQLVIGSFYGELKQTDKAFAYYEKAMKLAPKWSYPLNDRGILYLDLKQYDKAEADFRRAIKVDSALVLSWYNLGLVYDRQKNYKEAENIYRKAIEINPGYTGSYGALAGLYEIKNDLPSAEKFYLSALRIDSLDADSWIGLGSIYGKEKKHNEAVNAFEKALEIFPSSSNWVVYGNYYYDRLDDDKAEPLYMKAIDLDSSNLYAWYNLGLIYETQKRYPRAEAAFLHCVSIDNTYADAWTRLAKIYDAQKDNDKAANAYEKLAKLDPTAFAFTSVAVIYISQGKDALAEISLNRALQLDSMYVSALDNLGYLNLKKQNYSEAKKLFQRSVIADSTGYYAWHSLGRASYFLNEIDKAETYVKRSIRLDSTYQLSYDLLDKIYEARALDYIKTADDLIKQKQFSNAETWMFKAMKLFPEDPEVLYNMAALYSAWNKKDAALKYFSHACEKGFKNFDRAMQDVRLDNLIQTEEYKGLVSKYR
jgi:protein O-mannosyl-transferase